MELRLAMRFAWEASLWIATRFSFTTKTNRNWFISMKSPRKQTKRINSFITTSITRSSSQIVIEVVLRFHFTVVRWEHGDWSEKTDLTLLLLCSVMKTGQFNEYTFADIITRYKYEVELNVGFWLQGVTLFEDQAGFGLIKTLNILANTEQFAHAPIECSKVRWKRKGLNVDGVAEEQWNESGKPVHSSLHAASCANRQAVWWNRFCFLMIRFA